MNNIQFSRVKANLTQKELASVINVDRSTIAKWETDRALPRAELLPKLAKALHCSIDDLIEDDAEKGDENNAETDTEYARKAVCSNQSSYRCVYR